MTNARFSIGIDLGTTNSVMAFVPIGGNAPSEVVRVSQWDSVSARADCSTLPSFIYLPESAVAAQIKGSAPDTSEWIVGVLARKRAWEVPGRVVHSAKSWLCHHAADREAPFLPWASEEISASKKISPVRASALVLAHLRDAWNDRFAASGADFAFDAQDITIGVPASFDVAAQGLTLAAAREAGFPDSVRLLEEPQAAFYRWLEQHNCGRDLWSSLPTRGAESGHVVVVDVGGGTSDFSLFQLRPTGGGAPKIKRLVVSDHILLGGDNIDLALAHLVEPRLIQGGGKLAGSSWEHLVARCRDLKERALSSEGSPDEVFGVSVPGRGSRLVADALSVQLTRAEIERVLLDGFFPECDSDARIRRGHAALKEWGLPYATDSAITRHLAGFLQGRPRTDWVLFNGGSLYPETLRRRICQQIGKWQGSPPPLALVNDEPDLAVARGAARSGKLLRGDAERIEAGAARAVFLEAHGKSPADGEMKAPPSLVCILPRGAAAEQVFEITDLALELRINRPVRFQTYSSTRHGSSKAGDVIPWAAHDVLHALPQLQTIARLQKPLSGEPRRTIAVVLTAKLSELGLLQVSCSSTNPAVRQSWPLDFDLRAHDLAVDEAAGSTASSLGPDEPNAVPTALAAANQRIESLFALSSAHRDKLTATRLLETLEKILGVAKGQWNLLLVRALWSALETCAPARKHSVEHEETWLILAGFLLRPGFGAASDEAHIDSLWNVRKSGLCFPNKRIKLQEYILWRRVAGGLSRERQEAVLAAELDKIRRQRSPAPELIRLAGSLERIDHETKAELIRRFIDAAAHLAHGGQHCAPYLAALGLLLNRAPLYAGPEAVVSPQWVELAYEALVKLDWPVAELSELQTVFLRAARVVNNRSLDVPERLRIRIADKLERLGVAPLRTARIRGFVPVGASERLGLFGESLPPGLILSER